MKNILVINSSLQGELGNSNKATKQYVEHLENTQSINKTLIDLHKDDIPHLSGAEMQAWGTKLEDRSEQQAALASISDNYIAQIQEADEIVLGVPMYNFGIPSVLKAFFDRIARAGITFSYSENGPKGLLKGKKVTVLAARGGKYKGTALDTQSDYLTNFWRFLGVKEVNIFYIEGLAMGEEASKEAWQQFANELKG